MIPNHLNVTLRGTSRLTGIALALLTALCFAAFLTAQPAETPITIGDGSIKLTSATPWPNFSGPGNSHNHPNANGLVTSIDIFMPNLSHTIDVNNEKVEVTVAYGTGSSIKVTTNGNGRRLSVNADFPNFRRGANDNELVHNDPSLHITSVTVTRSNGPTFISTASTPTRVIIHYR